jgi:hypothetical protein
VRTALRRQNQFSVVALVSPISAACCGLVFAAALLSCKPAPQTNTVVDKAQSPNGRLSAILVNRHYHAARISDEFFIVLIPSGQSVDEAINARHIGDSAPLVATWANKVQLRWQSNDKLLVICDSCGLRAIDISKKLDRVGSVKISYEGFPEHTAYQ